MSGYFIRYTYPMKDTRPSRKTSRAQDNIRRHLADIANYGDSSVGRTTKSARRSRYKDFEKSEKQAMKDHELLFEYDPIIVNEVEAPAIEPTEEMKYILEDTATGEEQEVTQPVYHMMCAVHKRWAEEKRVAKQEAIDRQYKYLNAKDMLVVMACVAIL